MEQKKVWDTIAPLWNTQKIKPSSEVEEFLRKSKERFLIWVVEVGEIFNLFLKIHKFMPLIFRMKC